MKRFTFFLLALVFSSHVFAQQNYPELMVSPLASERLKREAVYENKNKITPHLPIQISGIATLAAGISAHSDLDKDKDEEGVGPKIAMVVGGSWVLATLWMQASYRPYLKGYNEVKKMPYATAKNQLAAERRAEEHIDETARFYRKLKWLSFGSNLLASGYALDSAKKDSTGQAISIVGVAASFLPLLFPYHAEQVSEDQRNYKKKVFGPITFGNGLLTDPVRGKPVLGLTAALVF